MITKRELKKKLDMLEDRLKDQEKEYRKQKDAVNFLYEHPQGVDILVTDDLLWALYNNGWYKITSRIYEPITMQINDREILRSREKLTLLDYTYDKTKKSLIIQCTTSTHRFKVTYNISSDEIIGAVITDGISRVEMPVLVRDKNVLTIS